MSIPTYSKLLDVVRELIPLQHYKRMTWLVKLKQYIHQSWRSLTQDLRVLRENPIPAGELNRTFLPTSPPTLNFYLLLALASFTKRRQ